MVMKKSKFWEGLTPEQYSYIAGINQTTEEKTLIKPHTRYLSASTDYSAGISLRKLGLSSDGLGFGRLPYDATSLYSGFARGMGIFQLQGNATNFSTYFTKIYPTGIGDTQSTSSWDQWTFNSTSLTNISSYSGRSSAPVGIQLPCKVFLNGVDVLTDFMQMVGAWNISSVTTPATLIQQGIAPTLPSTSGTGLTGYYAWCYTFVDVNGNESQPSPLVASGNLSNVGQNVTVTPTGITQGVWATIRLYRTLSASASIAANQNPTFYHVPGLDTAVTGAGSYTILDAVADTTLQLPTNYQMTNVNYINGALANLDVTAIPKFLVSWNNALWGGFCNIAAADNPLAVYYSASVDNSQTSTGNCTSWNSYNFINVGTLEDGEIIGLYPGLQGRLFVFKEFSTYIIQPTGNSLLPYSCVPISGAYGLYHHSIAEIGGAVMGRARDGIYQFNGSTFRQLTHPIYPTMNRLIMPEADSGIYDSGKERYYLAVCDSNITESYRAAVYYSAPNTSATSVINCFRNTVLIFDVSTGTWETHPNSPIQCFGKLKDSGGREKIFALGISADIFVLVDGNLQGSCAGYLVKYFNSTNLRVQVGINTGSYQQNALLFSPFYTDTKGDVQFLDYQTRSNLSIVHTGGTPGQYWLNFLLATPAPVIEGTLVGQTPTNTIMVLVPATDDTVSNLTSDLTSALFMTTNIYGLNKQYSFYDITSSTFNMWNDGGFYSSLADSVKNNVFNKTNESFTGVSKGDELLVLPYRYFPNYPASSLPYHAFVTPPFGIRTNDMAVKMFQQFRLQIKGQGKMYIYGFKNGNETYKMGPALCTPDETHSFTINSNSTTITTDSNSFQYPNSYQQMVDLKGLPAYYMRFMIWMYRGTGWFEIQDITCYSREQEQLAQI